MSVFLDGNDHEPEFDITRRNTSTGVLEPATGLSLRVRMAATVDGAALDASLDVPMTERPGKPGSYFGSLPGPAMHTYLAPYLDSDVYELVYDTTGHIFAHHRQPVKHRKV